MISSVSSTSNMTHLSEMLGVQYKPANLFVRARLLEEGMNTKVMLPNRVDFNTSLSSDDEGDLDKFVNMWNAAAKRDRKPLRISWINENDSTVLFNVEVL